MTTKMSISVPPTPEPCLHTDKENHCSFEKLIDIYDLYSETYVYIFRASIVFHCFLLFSLATSVYFNLL